MTGFSVVHLIDDHRAAVALVFPVLLFPLSPLPALEVPENTSKTKGRPRKHQDGPASCVGIASGTGGNSLESCLAGGGDYRRLVRGGDTDCTKPARRDPRGTCSTAQTAKLKEDDKTAID